MGQRTAAVQYIYPMAQSELLSAFLMTETRSCSTQREERGIDFEGA